MFFAIACPRTPKWMARRPEALRPGGSSFPSPNLLKAVSRGIPLATALQNGWRGVPMPFVPAAAFSPLRTSSKRCRAEYRLPPHSKMDGAASRSPSSRRQLFSLSEPPQSGVARNTACHRTPKWMARRPEALRPGGSSFPSQNLLKAVSRGIPLFQASPRMQTPRNGVESQNRKKCLNM